MTRRFETTPGVMLLCTHNSGRPQMAAGWLHRLAGDTVRVLSAGSEPGEAVNPADVVVMAEVGIDIAGAQPRRWTPEMVADVDVVVAMGCGDECIVVPVLDCWTGNLLTRQGRGRTWSVAFETTSRCRCGRCWVRSSI